MNSARDVALSQLVTWELCLLLGTLCRTTKKLPHSMLGLTDRCLYRRLKA